MSVKDRIVNISDFEAVAPLTQHSTVVAWKHPRTTCKHTGMAVPQSNFIDKNKQGATVPWPLIPPGEKRAREKKWEYQDN